MLLGFSLFFAKQNVFPCDLYKEVIVVDKNPLNFGLSTEPPSPLNTLSSKTDQHQSSPNNINTSSREKVMKINKRSPQGKCFDLLSNSFNYFFKKKYGD